MLFCILLGLLLLFTYSVLVASLLGDIAADDVILLAIDVVTAPFCAVIRDL